MRDANITTQNLELLPQTKEQVLALVEDMSPPDRAEVSPEWLARVSAAESADPWLFGFVMVHRTSGAVIGSCGYKDAPGPEAMVEIAYGVNAAHQGRGYATEAARALIDVAFASGRVRLVRAHTRPVESASTRVLLKCGFERIGEVVDPDDGLVWRWELQAPRQESYSPDR